MPKSIRRVVTGHDARGRSVVLSDGPPPQHHPMHGLGVGGDEFYWAALRFGERGVGLCERDGGELDIRTGIRDQRLTTKKVAVSGCQWTRPAVNKGPGRLETPLNGSTTWNSGTLTSLRAM
jgi:hypothetical protein